jgi:flavin-dependent dehydrogenase
MGSKKKVDVVVIGGGPAGAAVSMHLLSRGIQPLIVERSTFPRYHIGESMTGECGGLVRDLGFEDQMLADRHPHKHGVNVFGSRGNADWWIPMTQRTPDGVLHDQYTWSVRRSVFDKMLLDGAIERGADLLHGRAVAPRFDEDESTVCGVEVVTEDGTPLTVEAELTLDCSGQATFLANHKVTGPKYLGSYDKQIAVFTQIEGYTRNNGEDRSQRPGNTHIFYQQKYHWAWAIPLDEDVTSVGVVAPAEYFRSKKESKTDYLQREFRELNAGLAGRITDDTLVETPHVIPNYSFQVSNFAGRGFMCIGDSHRFVDPIFSFGLYVALAEARFAAEAAEHYLAGRGRDAANPFHEHVVRSEMAIDVLEDTIDTFWENPLAFAVFAHRRYRSPMIDVFSGRIYEGMPNDGRDAAIAAFRKLLGRERGYGAEDELSMPIGSRYHPERAPLWNAELDSVETTERWIRDLD